MTLFIFQFVQHNDSKSMDPHHDQPGIGALPPGTQKGLLRVFWQRRNHVMGKEKKKKKKATNLRRCDCPTLSVLRRSFERSDV
jgi:hypothetical protein